MVVGAQTSLSSPQEDNASGCGPFAVWQLILNRNRNRNSRHFQQLSSSIHPSISSSSTPSQLFHGESSRAPRDPIRHSAYSNALIFYCFGFPGRRGRSTSTSTRFDALLDMFTLESVTTRTLACSIVNDRQSNSFILFGALPFLSGQLQLPGQPN